MVAAFAGSPADSQVINGFQFFKVFDEQQLESGVFRTVGLESAEREIVD